MRTIRLAMALLALVPAMASAGTLRILTLNYNSEVVAFDDRDGLIRDLRFAAMVDYIREQKPDIVMIQEGWDYHGKPSLAIPLAEQVGYDQYYRIGEGFPGLVWDSNAILARKELRMDQRRKLKLPHSAWHIGDQVHWIIPFGKITMGLGVKLTLPGGDPLFVYTSHLIADTSSDRTDQIAALEAAARDHAAKNRVPWEQANVVIAGDMNSDPLSPPMRYLADRGYTDTFAEAHPEHAWDLVGATDCTDPTTPNYNPFQHGSAQLPAQDSVHPNSRIDYVWARGPRVKVLASTIVFTKPLRNVWMSDHYGVLTTLSFDGDWAPAANPVTDTDDGGVEPPARIFEVTDADFASCDHDIDCAPTAPVQDVQGFRGFVFSNASTQKLHIELKGPGRVLPRATATIDPGKVASFVFLASGDHAVKVNTPDGDILRTVARVKLR